MHQKYFKIVGNYPGYKKYQSGIYLSDSEQIYFTTGKNISAIYQDGIEICEVTIPENQTDKITNVNGLLWSNSVILGPKYSLFDPQTYKKFDIVFPLNGTIVDTAAKYGNIYALTKWKEYNLTIPYSSDAIDLASEYDHLDVLEWFANENIFYKYSSRAIDTASKKNNIRILNFWIKMHKSGHRLKYTNYAIDSASALGNIDVLAWWFNSNLTLKYTNKALDLACKYGQIDAMNCWKKYMASHELKIKISDDVAYFIIHNFDKVIDWLSDMNKQRG